MEIIIKNYIVFSVAYNGNHKKICKIIRNPFTKKRYIYDMKKNLRYITEIEKNNKNITSDYYNHNYQIIKNLPQAKKVIGTAEIVCENNESNEFFFRPPFINKARINFQSGKKIINIYLKRNGSCILKNNNDINIGKIKKDIIKGYTVEYLDMINKYELCAIFILSRYLNDENDFIIV